MALARYRESKRHSYLGHDVPRHVVEAADGPPAGGTPAVWDPADETVHGETKALLHEALAELSESYQEIIELRDLEELSTEEVAEKLGLTRVNVRVRLHRARKELRATFERQVEPGYRPD